MPRRAGAETGKHLWTMKRILMASADVVGENMAGPAIRAVELGRVLATRHDVTLAVPNQAQADVGVPLVPYRLETLAKLAAGFDVVIVGGLTLALSPGLAELEVPIVVDIYPFTLENLELLARHPMDERVRNAEELLEAVWIQLARGDFFLCASEKLRDFWLGMLHAVGRLNPHTYDADATLRSLVGVVPFGLPSEPPRMNQHGLKGTRPGIGERDFVAYWGGGLYDWLDPVTAVRAAGLAAGRNPRVRLFFPATKHPNAAVRPMAAFEETRRVSAELGLMDRIVFFNDWVPYATRADYLLDSDVGLSLHLDHIETAFSFRTRILDYVWAGLPIVATEGDTLASTIKARNLGHVVPVGDVEAVASALAELADEEDPRVRYAEGLKAFASELIWPRCAAALEAFCAAPRQAADRAALYRFVPPGGAEMPRGRLSKALASLETGGLSQLWADLRAYVGRRRPGA